MFFFRRNIMEHYRTLYLLLTFFSKWNLCANRQKIRTLGGKIRTLGEDKCSMGWTTTWQSLVFVLYSAFASQRGCCIGFLPIPHSATFWHLVILSFVCFFVMESASCKFVLPIHPYPLRPHRATPSAIPSSLPSTANGVSCLEKNWARLTACLTARARTTSLDIVVSKSTKPKAARPTASRTGQPRTSKKERNCHVLHQMQSQRRGAQARLFWSPDMQTLRRRASESWTHQLVRGAGIRQG